MTDVSTSTAASLLHPALGRPGLGFGGDYNPEQWPEAVWLEDARLMREAGVTFATVGVFSWARIQPGPTAWDFGWLDRVLDVLHEHEIAVDLATATASPPPWLSAGYPEMQPVDASGRRLSYGSRQSWCPSSPVYREHSLALVAALAERYHGHPALVLWHVSNELGCHNAHCYCDVSAAAFRGWLADRYGDLESLNAAWGTDFWSQRYSDWSEILPPRVTTAQPNPTQQLDFRRFSSDALLSQHRAERAVLDRLSPGVPVTTNFMVTSHVDGMDYWSWAPEQDVISQDHYLDHRLEHPTVELSFAADWTRGLASGRPWVLMEHSTSAVNWQPRNLAKAPGEMLRNSLAHVARGADTVGFFQWRASRAGAEKYHSAMLPHGGTDTRLWHEVIDLGATLERLAEVAGTTTVAEVAMVLDYESWWAVERDSLPRDDLRYLDRAHALYLALWERGVTVDMHPPGADLSGYALVVAPMLHLLRDADAAALTSYVEGGGHLLVTYFSGIVDENDHIRLGGYPGALRDLLGIRVEEFCPLSDDQRVGLTGDDGLVAGWADTWIEDLRLAGATTVLSYADGPLAGVPACTRRRHGDGLGWYLAARTSPEATEHVLARVMEAAGVAGAGLPAGVEVVRRSGPQGGYLFVLNHTTRPVDVPAAGRDLVAGSLVEGVLRLEAGAVACVREEGP